MTGPAESSVDVPAKAVRRAFCTYFDSNYLSRGILMLGSLLRHDPAALAYVLCFDETTEKVLNGWFGQAVVAVSLQRLHQFDARLQELRATRTTWEFYATHKAALVHYVMSECGPFEWVMVIDADTEFYGSVAPVLDEIGGASIGLSPHRFPREDDSQLKHGKFNAGFICFRDDPISRRCVRDWREDCIDWCCQTPLPDGRFMNQGYLNRWPERYPNVAIIRHPGANLGPWNLRSHRIEFVDGAATVDGRPLIFFHFSALVRHEDGHWQSFHSSKFDQLPHLLTRFYTPYIQQIEQIRKKILDTYGVSGTGSVRFMPNP